MKKVLIIAEAGVNHNGSIELAKKLVDAAAAAGADFVKFQTFKAENLVTKTASKAKYQAENTNNDDTQFKMLKELELTEEMHVELMDYCKKKKINFLSTPFDKNAALYLEDKVDLWKIPSGELTNFPFIKFLAEKKKPIILSTGMANLEEVKETTGYIKKVWSKLGIDSCSSVTIHDREIPMLSILHCTTAYPTPYDQVNLLAMKTLESETGIPVGYSDHTLGIEIPVAAVAIGARIIEKHFTLNKNMPGPDHKASLEPEELLAMVKSIRNIEVALGTGVKAPSEVEKINIEVARKSLYYAHGLEKGHVLSEEDLAIKRPGNGLAPKNFEKIVGKTLAINVEPDQQVELKDFLS